MKLRSFIYSLSLFVMCACKNENPFVSKDYIDQHFTSKSLAVQHVVYVYNNDVYYLSDSRGQSKRLTFTPSQTKSEVRISHNGSKIAYLDQYFTPTIIDTMGYQINVLTNFTNVDKMDWSANDQTLYMLINNEVRFYGPSMALPKFIFPNGGTNIYLLSMSVNSNQDIAYIFKYDSFQGTTYKAYFVAKGSTEAVDLTNTSLYNPKYVQFMHKTNDLLLGYDYNTTARGISAIEVFSSPYKTPAMQFSQDGYYVDPFYRQDISTMVAGKSNFIDGPFHVRVDYVPQDLYQQFTGTSTQPIYVDWK